MTAECQFRGRDSFGSWRQTGVHCVGSPSYPILISTLGTTIEKDQLQAKIITGEDVYNTTGQTKVTNEIVTVKKLLGPLTPDEVPFLRCIGLNYAKHSKPRLLRKTIFLTDVRQSAKQDVILLHSHSILSSPVIPSLATGKQSEFRQ